MKEKINSILNIIMISFISQFIGSGLYKYWHFRKYPNLYAMQSAPWYLSIFVYGIFTMIILASCLIIKIMLKREIKGLKKIALIFGIIFLSLTFIGGGYVIINRGQVNAGYAVVPGIFAIVCFAYYRSREYNEF